MASIIKVDEIQEKTSGNGLDIANLNRLSLKPSAAPSNPVQGDMYLDSSDKILKIYTGTNWVTIVNASPSFSVEYLVVAGGGSGNDGYINASNLLGGGGGAGGLLNGYADLVPSNNYFVEVGSGGTYVNLESSAPAGSDSQFSTFALAYGGGGGGTQSRLGGDGGSGGGGGSNIIAGGKGVYPGSSYIDEPRQGYDGGTTTTNGAYGGGGGGAGGAGGVPTAGVGKTFSITGSSVVYATGGAGGTSSTGNGVNGSDNTGNGGGGTGPWSTGAKVGGNGGSGIVVISYLNSNPDLQTIHSSHVCNGQSAGSTTAPAPSTARNGYKTYIFTAGSGNISW